LVQKEKLKLKFACPAPRTPPSSALVSSAGDSKPHLVMVLQVTPDNRWAELCTGYVTCIFDGAASGFRLDVSGPKPFCALISPDIDISIQNEKSLVWKDHQGIHFALSFEHIEGCHDVWAKLRQLKELTPESQAAAFWRDQHWATEAMIPWGDFLTALKRQAKGPIEEMSPFISHIMFYPDMETRSVVTLSDFVKFLAWFGPVQECANELASIIHEEWFHWFISREQSIQMLQGRPAGTFLIRFSSQQGCFALSYADRLPDSQQIVVQHTLISRAPRIGRPVLVMSKVGGGVLEYPTLKVLVEAERAKLLQPCPREIN